eukprot:gene7890-biopygen7852
MSSMVTFFSQSITAARRYSSGSSNPLRLMSSCFAKNAKLFFWFVACVIQYMCVNENCMSRSERNRLLEVRSNSAAHSSCISLTTWLSIKCAM